MRAQSKWAVGIVAAVVVLAGGALAALSQWAGSDDFRARVQHAATQALGVPVQLGEIEITLWPALAVAVRDVRIQTRPPLTLAQIDATPVWSSLLLGRPKLDALVVRYAVLPQQGILALVARLQKQSPKPPTAKSAAAMADLPRRIQLDQVTWIDAIGQRLTVNAEVDFDSQMLPHTAKVDVVAGRYAGARAHLERDQDGWQLRANIGGGSITGPLRLQPHQAGWRFSGSLVTDKVEVAALTAPSRSLTGRVEARTSMQAEFNEPAALLDALRTQTRFTVRRAVLHGIDLAQAVRTLGISRSGETPFDTLTGFVTTQGRAVQLNELVANSGSMSATGHVSLALDRSLNGKVNVTLAGGAFGVPVQVAGTLDAPSASPSGVSLPGSQAAADLGGKIGSGLRGLFGR